MEGIAFGNFHITEVWMAVCEVDYDWAQLRGLGGGEGSDRLRPESRKTGPSKGACLGGLLPKLKTLLCILNAVTWEEAFNY
jgi:hypothetical protein